MNYNYFVEKDIPFLEHGRDEDGLDCWGLVKIFYEREMGVILPDLLGKYEDTKDLGIADIVMDLAANDWTKIREPQNGDVVLCRMRSRPMHVGVYKHPHLMLHIEQGNSPILDKLDGIKWEKRILGIYRLKSLM